MTDAQNLVLKWKAALKEQGWPEEAVRKMVSDLCEAGYRQCIDDIQAKNAHKEKLIHAATGGAIN